MSSKEYQKKTGYAAQKKYAAQNYSNIIVTVYKEHKAALIALARDKGISMSKLVTDALAVQYGIDFSKPNRSETDNKNENA